MKSQAAMLSPFEQHLKEALRLFADPERLGAISPLASPYFLSQLLPNLADPHTALTRGKTLCAAMQQAAALLWEGPLPQTQRAMREALLEVRQAPGTWRYSYLILELRCFQQFFKPRRTAAIWEDENYLPGSKSEHYRDFDLAVSHLGQMLLKRLYPVLRPESAPAPTLLLGYEAYIEQAVAALQQGKTVALNGPGGVGKTALGGAIVTQLAEHPSFWFTLRPSLNDRAGSLLFALGHFLHGHGASHLWQYLLAAGGVVSDQYLALALLRQDLAALPQPAPLLCFDELDRLVVEDWETAAPAHVQLIELIRALRGLAPLLLIGQKPVLEADLHLALRGLAGRQIEQLFHAAAIPLLEEDVQRLYHATNGNPRLLRLCIALHQSGETLPDLLAALVQSPGLLLLLQRLGQQLSPAERQMLQRLAVFRSAAPEASWPDAAALLHGLARRALVQRDGQGGVELLPALRTRIYEDWLTPALRERLHLEAAQIRLVHGEYTAAAYHYARGQRADKAIQLWYGQKQQELSRGQGDAALVLFANLSSAGLSKTLAQMLAVIQAELYQLRGEWEKGLERLAQQTWTEEQPIAAQALALRGNVLDHLGQHSGAQQAYADAITVAGRLLRQLITWRRERSRSHLRQKELAEARREAALAEGLLHNLRGQIEEEGGHYDAALASYQQALTLAEQWQDQENKALAERYLAILYGRKGHLAQAEEYTQRVIDYCGQIKDYFGQATMYGNLAAIYNMADEYAKVIEAGHKAIDAFEATGSHYHLASIMGTLADAYFSLGNLVQAQQYAEAVLRLKERQPIPYALLTLGSIQRSQGDPAQAAGYLRQAIQAATANQDGYIEAFVQRELGALLLEQGQTTLADQALRRALQLFEQRGLTEEIAATQQLLVGIGD